MIQTALQNGLLGPMPASGTFPIQHPLGLRSQIDVIAFDGLLESATGSSIEGFWPAERTAPNLGGHCCVSEVESTATAVMEIRRKSGLTWGELSEVFDVSRRSVHNWASGKAVSAGHEKAIRQVLAAIRWIDLGDQASTRAQLREVDAQTGQSLLDQLRAKQFDAVWPQQTAPYQGVHRSTSLAKAAWNAHRPSPPTLLLQAEQDRPDIATNTRVISVARPAKAQAKD